MKNSRSLMLLMVSFLLTEFLVIRAVIFILFSIVLIDVKRKKIEVSKDFFDIVIGISIIVFNMMLNLDLFVINFVVLVVLNVFLYFKPSACRFVNLLNVYWICVLFKGVMIFWENI